LLAEGHEEILTAEIAESAERREDSQPQMNADEHKQERRMNAREALQVLPLSTICVDRCSSVPKLLLNLPLRALCDLRGEKTPHPSA
jgi:hypothetical protein